MWPVCELRRTYDRNREVIIISQFFRITEKEKKPMAKGPKTWFCVIFFYDFFFCSPDDDDSRAEAPEVVRPTRLPVQPRDGLGQPHRLLALLLHLRHEVAVLRPEVLLDVLEWHVSRGTRVLTRPVTRDRHVATRGLVLQPQLRPGLAEPEAAASRLVAAVDQGSSPQSWDRLRNEFFFVTFIQRMSQMHTGVKNSDNRNNLRRRCFNFSQWEIDNNCKMKQSPMITLVQITRLFINDGWYNLTSCGQFMTDLIPTFNVLKLQSLPVLFDSSVDNLPESCWSEMISALNSFDWVLMQLFQLQKKF